MDVMPERKRRTQSMIVIGSNDSASYGQVFKIANVRRKIVDLVAENLERKLSHLQMETVLLITRLMRC